MLLQAILLSAGWLGSPTPAVAQAEPVPVVYVVAVEAEVRETVRLSGTVEAPRRAVVATEVAGVVDALLVREGQAVRRGDALARLRVEPTELRLRAAQGQLAEADARLSSAEIRLERLRGLAGSVVSEQQVDEALHEAEAWEGRAEQLRAEVERLERELRLTTVTAPFSGVVRDERTHAGEWLSIGAAVVEMLSLDGLEIRLEVPERYYSRLEIGGPVPVSFEAVPGLQIEGVLRAVVPSADATSRTFPALVRLPTKDGDGRRLGAGMLAATDLPIGASRRAVLVPKDALVERAGGRLIFVLGEDGAVRAVTVVVGASRGAWVAVDGDVRAGEQVVVRGNESLTAGDMARGERLELDPP